MKRLVCEMCGSTDLIKQEGFFVCQTCGCKYSVEEAKKMMVEGVVEVVGTVNVDNSGQIENYLKMAKTAQKSENYKDAEGYANKIIEIDPNNTDAWFIKGQAAAWDNRVREGIECWSHAITGIDEDKKKEYDDLMASEIVEVLKASTYIKASSFGHYPSQTDKIVLCDLSYVDEPLQMMREKLDVDMSLHEEALYDSIAEAMNKGIVMGWDTAAGLRGSTKEERNRYAYEAWLKMAVLCVDVAKAAIQCARGEDELNNSFKYYKIMQEEIIDSESYKMTFVLSILTYVPDTKLTDVAKAEIRKDLKETTELVEKKKMDIVSLQKKKQEERRIAYWESHLKRKNELENEKETLNTQIAELRSHIDNLPETLEIPRLEKEKSEAQGELEKLGMFKGKEKKALQAKIDELNSKIDELKKARENVAKPLEETISQHKKRLYEVNDELDNPEGTIETDNQEEKPVEKSEEKPEEEKIHMTFSKGISMWGLLFGKPWTLDNETLKYGEDEYKISEMRDLSYENPALGGDGFINFKYHGSEVKICFHRDDKEQAYSAYKYLITYNKFL